MAASTVDQYLAALPPDRRAAITAVRKTINENLPNGYEEGMQFGMIGWYVPLSMYPAGYGENPVGYGSGIVVGGAVSELSCDGSVNSGPVGHVALVSAYRATDWTLGGPPGSTSTYEGAFAGA